MPTDPPPLPDDRKLLESLFDVADRWIFRAERILNRYRIAVAEQKAPRPDVARLERIGREIVAEVDQGDMVLDKLIPYMTEGEKKRINFVHDAWERQEYSQKRFPEETLRAIVPAYALGVLPGHLVACFEQPVRRIYSEIVAKLAAVPKPPPHIVSFGAITLNAIDRTATIGGAWKRTVRVNEVPFRALKLLVEAEEEGMTGRALEAKVPSGPKRLHELLRQQDNGHWLWALRPPEGRGSWDRWRINPDDGRSSDEVSDL